MKKVLIALDYSPTAQKVAELGYTLASEMDAEVILLHIISDSVYYYSSEFSPVLGYTGFIDSRASQDNDLVNNTQHFLDVARQHLDDQNIKTIIKEGDFAEMILSTAKEIKADMIVLGSHSHRWLANILMGSVTEKVLHHATIPLLIIPTKKTDNATSI